MTHVKLASATHLGFYSVTLLAKVQYWNWDGGPEQKVAVMHLDANHRFKTQDRATRICPAIRLWLTDRLIVLYTTVIISPYRSVAMWHWFYSQFPARQVVSERRVYCTHLRLTALYTQRWTRSGWCLRTWCSCRCSPCLTHTNTHTGPGFTVSLLGKVSRAMAPSRGEPH